MTQDNNQLGADELDRVLDAADDFFGGHVAGHAGDENVADPAIKNQLWRDA